MVGLACNPRPHAMRSPKEWEHFLEAFKQIVACNLLVTYADQINY